MSKIVEMKNAGKASIRKERYHDIRSCNLTEKEIANYATEMAHKFIELNNLESEKKSIVSEFKSRIENIETRIQNLSQRVTTGKEMRQVECEKVYDYDESVVYHVRLDTGETFNIVPMTDSEKQLYFPG